ncbi:hypothetical protein DWB77_06610 [Streptomyces hundungensis]|uniref:Orc1-like AAA ATPase domain-containing protein n=1 Tax=Streptomyces hundungensis TaxID=1077946 RepID=A0A387HKK1_9ACTN|nr:hypothetical protein [Streptomyces hundungensis]AYG84396.1 hypothetical protein DWB77_06610 [Streptomyces hundungensis]
MAAGQRHAGPRGRGCLAPDVLGTFQGRSPVILVIDDVHWADIPSLHALTFVLRRLPAFVSRRDELRAQRR